MKQSAGIVSDSPEVGQLAMSSSNDRNVGKQSRTISSIVLAFTGPVPQND